MTLRIGAQFSLTPEQMGLRLELTELGLRMGGTPAQVASQMRTLSENIGIREAAFVNMGLNNDEYTVTTTALNPYRVLRDLMTTMLDNLGR